GVDQEEGQDRLEDHPDGRRDVDRDVLHLKAVGQGGDAEAGSRAAQHPGEREGGDDAAGDLEDDVGQRAAGVDLSGRPDAQGHRGVDVRAGDVAVGVGETDDHQAVGEATPTRPPRPRAPAPAPMKISANVPMNSASNDVDSLWYMQALLQRINWRY